MPDDTTAPAPPLDLRQWLRAGTSGDHDRLDALLGACDLQTRDGMSHFLLAHAIGLASVGPVAAGFFRDELGLAMPDPCAMVAPDLAALDLDMPVEAAPLPAAGAAGVAYVLIGSRMGVAALCKQGYWSPGTPGFSHYMQDRSLLALWSPLLGWLRQAELGPDDQAVALTAARAAFAAFEHGLDRATQVLAPA